MWSRCKSQSDDQQSLINPFAARTIYVQVQDSVKLNKTPLKKCLCKRCSVSRLILEINVSFSNSNIFCFHLKLEIV